MIQLAMDTLSLGKLGITKGGLEWALARRLGYSAPLIGIKEIDDIQLTKFHESEITRLYKFSAAYTTRDGSPKDYLGVLKQYKQEYRSWRRKSRDEAILLRFYERFSDSRNFPLLLLKLPRRNFLIRDYIPGMTYDKVNYNFFNKINDVEYELQAATDQRGEERLLRKKAILEKNQYLFLDLIMGALAQVHYIGTSNLDFLRRKIKLPGYRVRSPGINYYRSEFIDHVISLFGVEYTEDPKKRNDLEIRLARIFNLSRAPRYLEKQNDLILGDAHPKNIIISSVNGSDDIYDIYDDPSLENKIVSLKQRLFFTDVGKGKVGAAASDLVDLLNYPMVSPDWVVIRRALKRYVDERTMMEGRVASASDLDSLLDGHHFLTIFKAPHASIVDNANKKHYIRLLGEELEIDSNMDELKIILAPLLKRNRNSD